MARKMAARNPSVPRKAAAENVAKGRLGADQESKKKKTYKWTHNIGWRKATEKVVTYSESLPYYPDMVQQFLNDRDMEPKKASPAKSPTTKSPAAKLAASKSSPARSPKTGSPKSPAKSPSTKAASAKSPKTLLNKASVSKASPKSPSAKSPSAKKIDDVETSPRSTKSSPSGVKRKSDSDFNDASEAKKQKTDCKVNSVVSKTSPRTGKTDSRISVAEKLKKLSAKAEAEGAKKQKSQGTKKMEANKNSQKTTATEAKDKKSSSNKKDSPTPKKPVVKKRKKEEKEIPSLLSFIKPKREASLNANAMMDIMFEKYVPISPKKELSAKKSPANGSNPKNSPGKTPPSLPESSQPKNAKKRLVFDGIDKSSLCKGKKVNKKSKLEKGKSVSGNVDKAVVAGKVVKRRSKKRMASLNARALIVAERESMRMILERAARTDRYCVSWIRDSSQRTENRSPHRAPRWVDGLGNCGVCNSKKELVESVTGLTDVSSQTLPVHESKHPVSLLPPVHRDKEQHVLDDRPSSVVDVVTAHTPHVDIISTHQPNIINVMSPVKAQVLGGKLGGFGGLFGHGAPCMAPCPGYSYSRTEGYVTSSASYQSFTLSGMGTLNPMPLMTPMAPTYRPSAFSVPGYNVNMPYGYYPGATYYQPAPSPLMPQSMPEPCMLPHHMSVKVPHAQVKVLIHNPDPPQDLAAFSEHRSGKGDPATIDLTIKITNDNNNNSGSMLQGQAQARAGDGLTAVQITTTSATSKRRGSENTGSGKGEGGSRKREPGEGKKKDGENKRKDCSERKKKDNGDSKKKKDNETGKKESNGSKGVKNGESKRKDGEKGAAGRKDGEGGGKKKENGVVLKTRDTKDSNKDGTKVAKKKGEKKKKGDKGELDVDNRGDEIIPEHGWVWVGEPQTKKVVSVHFDQPSEERQCYQAIKHSTHGDVVNVRDCVLLRSGGCKSDVPYVAKVGALWEHPKSKEMMMSLLWYYQPAHTEAGRQPHDMENEVFASRHRDENSVACIDDKCFVLTFDEFCRYQAEMRRVDHHAVPRSRIVPDRDFSNPDTSPPLRELPDEEVDPANIFFCRKVYDFRMKRILKNPS